MSTPPILWQPSERAIEDAQVTQFARHAIRKHRLDFNSYPDFYRWTVDNPELFWSEVWDWCGVIASKKGGTVLVDGDKMPGARWFPEARLNFAENLLRRGDRGDALVFCDESGARRRTSYSDLTSEVSRAVQALAAIGLRAGDRAAAFIPNIPETSMLALAALSQGIVWSSCSPDFGVDGVVERAVYQGQPRITRNLFRKVEAFVTTKSAAFGRNWTASCALSWGERPPLASWPRSNGARRGSAPRTRRSGSSTVRPPTRPSCCAAASCTCGNVRSCAERLVSERAADISSI